MLNYCLLLVFLVSVGACNGVGTAKFDEAAIGTGGQTVDDDSTDDDDEPDVVDNGTDSTVSFAGISSISEKTDSTVKLHWTSHSDAIAYDLFETTSGTAILKISISGQASDELKLENLTPGSTYKFRLRMKTALGKYDVNTNDYSLTTNLAPDVPTNISLVGASNTSFYATPTLKVDGVKSPDKVFLYKGAGCDPADLVSNPAGVTVGAGETSVNVTASLPGLGLYDLYAQAENSTGHKSACSSVTVAYEYVPCPVDGSWIVVPGSATYSTNDFCVMKYEAKAQQMTAGVAGTVSATGGAASNWATIYHPVNNTTGHRPISQENGNPWRFITATDAKQACLNLGTGFDLITNAEWMTLATDVEAQPANWSTTTVGNGCIFRGNNSVADACGYNGSDPEAGTGRNTKARLTLSNGEEIWDLAGNVWEWTDWSHPTLSATSGIGFLKGPVNCTAATLEIPDVAANCAALQPIDYMPLNPGNVSPAENYITSFGLGQFWANNGGGGSRGGGFSTGVGAGVFSLNIHNLPSASINNFGFRCVYRP